MSSPFPELDTKGIKLTPDTMLQIDGGMAGDSFGGVGSLTGKCLLDDYFLPEEVVVFKFDKPNKEGEYPYVLSGDSRFIITLKNKKAPVREEILKIIQHQYAEDVTALEITFNEALEIAHKVSNTVATCEGLAFYDNIEFVDVSAVECFFTKSSREL